VHPLHETDWILVIAKMKIHDTNIFYSASDIVNFTQCEHRATMDLINLETPMKKAPDSEEIPGTPY